MASGRARQRRQQTIGVPRKQRRPNRIARGWTLTAVLVTLVAAGTHAPPTWGTPSKREPIRERIVSRDVQETARRVLGPRGAPSARAARARAVREQLADLRRDLAELGLSSSPEALSRIRANRQAAAESYAALTTSSNAPASAKAARGRAAALFTQIDEFLSDRKRHRNSVPHLLEEIDAALAVPESVSSLNYTITPITAEIDR